MVNKSTQLGSARDNGSTRISPNSFRKMNSKPLSHSFAAIVEPDSEDEEPVHSDRHRRHRSPQQQQQQQESHGRIVTPTNISGGNASETTAVEKWLMSPAHATPNHSNSSNSNSNSSSSIRSSSSHKDRQTNGAFTARTGAFSPVGDSSSIVSCPPGMDQQRLRNRWKQRAKDHMGISSTEHSQGSMHRHSHHGSRGSRRVSRSSAGHSRRPASSKRRSANDILRSSQIQENDIPTTDEAHRSSDPNIIDADGAADPQIRSREKTTKAAPRRRNTDSGIVCIDLTNYPEPRTVQSKGDGTSKSAVVTPPHSPICTHPSKRGSPDTVPSVASMYRNQASSMPTDHSSSRSILDSNNFSESKHERVLVTNTPNGEKRESPHSHVGTHPGKDARANLNTSTTVQVGTPTSGSSATAAPLSLARRTGPRTNRISLHIYDLISSEVIMQLPFGCQFPIGECFTAVNSSLHSMGTGAYHVGIEINGVEYAFGANDTKGATGVFTCFPKSSPGYQYRTTIEFGERSLKRKAYFVRGAVRDAPPTDGKPYRMIERYVDGREIIREMARQYMGMDYDLLRKNCCSFAHDACVRLGIPDAEIPSWFRNLAMAGAVTQDAARSATNPITSMLATCDCDNTDDIVQPTDFGLSSSTHQQQHRSAKGKLFDEEVTMKRAESWRL